MIAKYAKVNPPAPFDGTYQDPCEWIWIDHVDRVVHLGIHDDIPFVQHYRYHDCVGEPPFRCYMFLRADAVDVAGFGINDLIDAFLLSDDGKTIDRL